MSGFPAMVLCAGYGTRLRPLTDELPKPLVPVGDRPLLAHVAERLAQGGARVIALNSHHLPNEFDSVIQGLSTPFEVFLEPEIRGTAGGVAGAIDVLSPGPCIVHNGDILTHVPFDALLGGASAGGACLLVAPSPKGEGTVGVDAEGHLVRLRGEHFGAEASGGNYVGVMALAEEVLSTLPSRGCLIGDVVLPLLRAGRAIPTAWLEHPWSDVGDPAAYLRENMRWLADRRLSDEGWIGPGARVEKGVDCRGSIIGPGARVEGVGALRRSVVWPGARGVAPLEGCIVTTRGVVVRADVRATPAR